MRASSTLRRRRCICRPLHRRSRRSITAARRRSPGSPNYKNGSQARSNPFPELTVLADLPPGTAPPDDTAEELSLVEALVDQRTHGEFDLAGYRDEYSEKLLQLIEAKLNGQALIAAQEHQPAQTLSLMEALRQSVTPTDQASASRKPAVRLKGKSKTKAKTKATATTKNGSRRRPRKKSA